MAVLVELKKKPVLLRTTNSQKEINKIATEILCKNLLKRYVTHTKMFFIWFLYHVIEHF